MINILRILFGKGWYTLLYLITYFWYFIFPGITVVGYMKQLWEIAQEGGDHSGGLGMIIQLTITPFVLVPVLIVSSILWMTTISYRLWAKIFIVIGISIVVPIIIGIIGAGMQNKIFFFLYYLGYFGMFTLHLFMLHKFIIKKSKIMENQNQVPLQTQSSLPPTPSSLISPPSPEPSHKGKIWKIVGIILISAIVVFSLLAWYGFKLEKQEQNLSNNSQNNNQQNTTMDNQKDNVSAADYLAMQSESSDYRKFADKVVVELAKGNTKYLNDNLSPNLIAANSQGAVESTFLPAAKKLFTNFDHIGNSVTIQPSTDSYGNSGYSFVMTAVYRDNTEKDFKIYIIKEGGKLVVGNIVD